MADPFAMEAFGEIERRRARKNRGLMIHATMWAAVSAFLFLIWFITTGPGSFPWFLIPSAGWGIGLVAHGAAVRFSDDPDAVMLERERRRMLEGGGLPELDA